MKTFFLLACLCLGGVGGVAAQSFCASDGQPTPVALVERFINADCEACWQTLPPVTSKNAMTLDWIVPSAQGDDAILSAAASRDALMRQASLGRKTPSTSTELTARVMHARHGVTLRVAHGLAVGGYIGASIVLQSRPGALRQAGPLKAWLVLVETIPAGTEGTPITRNLVRNVLLSQIGKPGVPMTGPLLYRETRPLNVAPGARPERLRVVGWVEDAQGKVLSAAQSVCAVPEEP